MNKKLNPTAEDLEDYAFYQSGLSAHGCLEKLDNYMKEAIKRYGRILLDKQIKNIKEGFQGCCYTCEPVGMMNQELEKKILELESLNK